MDSKKFLLWLIFAITLAIRLSYALSTPHFSTDETYFTLRQVEHITHTGLPLYADTLSYGGRTFLFNPLYMYILAFFNLFLPITLVAKLIPNIFIASIVFIIYYIVKDTTDNPKIALLGAAVSPVIPIYFVETLNDASVYSLVIPMMFLTLFLFVNIRKHKKYGMYCATAMAALALTHPSSLLFIFAFIIYYLFLKVENLPVHKAEKEVMIFSTIFVIVVQFFIFRHALIQQGISVIYQNIPSALLASYFKDITILQAVYQIGIIPLFYGIYVVYRYLFREKEYTIYLYISFAFAVSLLLWFKFIPINSGLMFLGAILLLLFTQRFVLYINFIKKTKFAKYETLLLVSILISFLITSLVPALALGDNTMKNSFSDQEIEAFSWIDLNLEKDAVIFATLEEGHLITYYGKRKNYMDSNFLRIDDVNERYENINRLYTTVSQTEAYNILAGSDYLIFSERAKSTYSSKLEFFNRKCLKTVFRNDEVRIFKILCGVETL